ncbi:hypothetical protein, partial [Burkholderia sp. SIMBA_024]|uniref:hypothetical protein n=1 Tax=Burkholderia sp. SIMBA_024 TaxID=3085768 RepID=UPI00397B6599
MAYAVEPDYTTITEYDAVGNVLMTYRVSETSGVTVPGHVTHYRYDELDRLTHESDHLEPDPDNPLLPGQPGSHTTF